MKVGSLKCTAYLKWSATKIICRVPTKSAIGALSVRVATSKGASNRVAFTVTVPTVLGPKTKVLSGSQTAKLTSVAADQSTLTFSGGTPSGVAVGKILQVSACAAAPGGLLRQVTAISDSGGSTTVSTVPASLEQAYQSLDFSCSQQITSTEGLRLAPGVRLLSTAKANSSTSRGSVPLSSFTLGIDKNFDGLHLSGKITLAERLDLNATISWFHLKSAYLAAVSTETCDLSASASRGWSADKQADIPLGTLPTAICGVPVLLHLDLIVGAKADLKIGVSTALHQSASFTIGASYANGKFSPVVRPQFNTTYDPPTLWGTADVKAYAGPQVSASICGVAGPYVGVDGYGEFVADTRSTPWWTLHGGLEGTVGFSLQVFSLKLADWSYTNTFYDQIFAQAPSGSAPPAIGTIDGTVVDSAGDAIAGATVTVKNNGPNAGTATTESDGTYSVDVPPGTYSVTFSQAGYLSQTIPNVDVAQDVTTTLDTVYMVSQPAVGQTKIVLSWGATPSDLDSHLVGPDGYGSLFHVYYRETGDTSYAALDHDCTTSYGPEAITIYSQLPGTYTYGVHDYTDRDSSDSDLMSLSGATVQIYRSQGLIATFTVPAGTPGTLWTVFRLDGNSVTPINSMTFESDPALVLMP